MQTAKEETQEDLREAGEKVGGVRTAQARVDQHTRYLRA